jgi:putative component of toxin-antitoxin plasmid stabilization module
MASVLDVRLFETSAGRRPVKEFLDGLPVAFRIQVTADVHLVATHGRIAPVSVKTIKGPLNRGLLEIRTGGYRTFFCLSGDVMWVLHGCKKQDQERGIETARQRMKQVR